MGLFPIRLSELERLPVEARQAILDRCQADPSLQQLASRRAWSVRLIIGALIAAFALQFARDAIGLTLRDVLRIQFAAILLAVLTAPALYLWYTHLIGLRLRELVRRAVDDRT